MQLATNYLYYESQVEPGNLRNVGQDAWCRLAFDVGSCGVESQPRQCNDLVNVLLLTRMALAINRIGQGLEYSLLGSYDQVMLLAV